MALSLVGRAVGNTLTSSCLRSISVGLQAIGGRRYFSSKDDDESEIGFGGKCRKLKCDPCNPKQQKPKEKKLKSMWENPECCMELIVPVCDTPVRADVLLWRPSDKAARQYQQTWVECGKLVFAQKPKCHNPRLDWPKMKRRKRKPVPKQATAQSCEEVAKSKCPKITLDCCRPARDPPRCTRQRIKLICEKVKAPSPAFSECKRDPVKPKRPDECRCLMVPSDCEVWKYMRMKGIKMQPKK